MFFDLTKSKIFLYCCLAFIIGIAVASFLPVEILEKDLWWFAGAVACGVLAVLFWRNQIGRLTSLKDVRRPGKAPFVKGGILVLLFFFLAIWRYDISPPADDYGKIWHYNGEDVTVIGVISNEPDAREDKIKLEVESKKLKVGRENKDVSGKILVTTNLYPRYEYGDELEIKCKLQKPKKIKDFGYDRYLARYNIYSVCYWSQIKLLADKKGNWVYQNIFSFKNKLRDVMDAGLPEPESSLAGPLILGGQRGMSAELREDFARTGLSHITAVSGMNVSMLAAMVALVLYNFSLKRKHIFLISSVFLLFYVILVGAPASAMRAGLMGFLVLWALHLGRLNKIANSLALAAAILLFINPKLLRDDIGFQLSFLAILGLAYFYPLIDGWLEKKGVPRLKGMRDVFSATMAAQILTLPIIAVNFSKISLIAPLANLLVLWVLPPATIVILAAMFLGFIFSSFDFLFFFPSLLFLKYIIFAVQKLAQIPYAYLEVDYLSKWWVVVYYISIVAVILKDKFMNLKKFSWVFILAFAVVIFFAGFPMASRAADSDYYDFQMEDITISPASPAVNQDSVITVKIKNAGTKILYTSLGTNTYNYQFDNFAMSKVFFTPPSYSNIIYGGGYLYYTIEGKFISKGEKNLTFKIDAANETAENNEDNNSLSKKITVVAAEGVDLAINSISLNSDKPLVNSNLTITVILRNAGTVSLTSSAGLVEEDLLLNFSSFDIKSKNRDNFPTVTAPLNPGGTFKYIYSGSFSSVGDNSLFFQFDRNNRLVETNEYNNSITVAKTIYLTTEAADAFDFSVPVAEAISSTSVKISWATSKETTGRVTYKEKIYETIENEALSSTATTTHQIILSNLKRDTTYYYRVIATRDSITRDSGYREFKTLATDNIPASVSVIAPTSATSSAPSTLPASPSQTASSPLPAVANTSLSTTNASLYKELKGKIVLKVESKGEAYYVNVRNMILHYLGRPDDAFKIMREQGVGITNSDLLKISIGLSNLSGIDTDKDGLPDMLEDAVGSDKTKADTDGDGHGDKTEIQDGFSPLAKNAKLPLDSNFAAGQKGKIFLQTERRGEAWYVSPADGKRYFLGRPADAFGVMRNLGLGISNNDFSKL